MENHEFEKKIIETYTSKFMKSGLSENEAKKLLSQIINETKEKTKREGADYTANDAGYRLLDQAEKGDPVCLRIVNKAKNEGATIDDILEWWNVSELEKELIVFLDNTIRYASFLYYVEDKKLSPDEAMAHTRKDLPFYGDPDDTSNATGDDRPICIELMFRVRRFMNELGPNSLEKLKERYPTINALVRAQIRLGNL